MELEKEIIEKANISISKAIMQLMRYKYLAFDVSVILNLPRKYTTDIPLIAVSKTTLLINPITFVELSELEQQFALRHEAWHIIGFDLIRLGTKDPKHWNIACDHWINLMITNDSNNKLTAPEGVCCDPKFKGWDKEKIYEYIIQHNEDSQNSKFDYDLDTSNNMDGQEDTEILSELDELKKEIDSIISQASIQAKFSGGVIPENIKHYLDKLYNPQIKWDRLLVKYMDAYSHFDFSYRKFNRKFLPHNIILPSIYSENLGDIYLALDESASVEDKDYELYLGALQDIRTRLEPTSMTVIGFTTEVTKVVDINDIQDIEDLKARTMGGTYIPCVFDYIKTKRLIPKVLIVFSDMESALPEKPSYDVIWICVNNSNWKPPYGKVIYVASSN